MSQHLSSDSKANTIGAIVSLRVAIALLLLNFAFLCLLNWEFRKDTIIFYWQQFTSYLEWFYFLTCLLPPIFIVIATIGGIKQLRSLRFWIPLVISFYFVGICLFINYTSLFFFTSVDHIGTAKLHSDVYQLAKTVRYDDESAYYLGKCDQTGYWCNFHEIYRMYLFTTSKAEIQLDENTQRLVVKVNHEIVYTYDGESEYCTDSLEGYCPER